MNKNKLKNLPTRPGCYLFTNKKGRVIYVGKAKNLHNRLRSYFAPNADLAPAKQQMVKEINNIKTIIVASETEALFLETNLIKKHRPKYNVVMKDDKNFCYLKVTLKPKLQARVVRLLESDKNAKYYGPYLSSTHLRQLLKLLKYFDTPKQRRQTILSITEYLRGKPQSIIRELQIKMKSASVNKNFELAIILRDRLLTIQKIISTQTIISSTKKNQDIISLYEWQNKNVINLFRIRQGKLVDKINFNIRTSLKEKNEIITNFVAQYYQRVSQPPQEIILPVSINITAEILTKLTNKKIKIIIPKKGKYKKLINLGELNAQAYLQSNIPNFANKNKQAMLALSNLQKTLGIKNISKRIECYDISNIQGKYAVGSMAVFTDGTPDKSQYRRFKIKYTRGINDFAMLNEIIVRRYNNHPNWPTANLLIIDGGKGQLSTVLKTLKNLKLKIPVIALAKKHEEIFLPQKSSPIYLKTDSAELFLVQRIRDEAHRFAINYYRKRHLKSQPLSILNNIPGVGPQTKRLLLKNFKSISGIKKAKVSEISTITNPKLAHIIKNSLNL